MKTLLKTFLLAFLALIIQLTNAQTLSKAEYDMYSALFAKDALYRDSVMSTLPPPTYSQEPLTVSTVYSTRASASRSSNTKKILIIANNSIYQQTKSKIKRYADDVSRTYRCWVIIRTVTGGTPEDIKNVIISDSTYLKGVVFIGDIPAAYYEVDHDHPPRYLYSYWQCELFYMDLDGVWEDTDGNNIYDSHTGNVAPEIFVGRISTAHMDQNFTEKEGLENYLDKLHNFYMGNVQINNKYALAYTDTDWANSFAMCNHIGNLYGTGYYHNFNAINNPNHGKTDYLEKLGDTTYEFIQLAAHSAYDHHAIVHGNSNHNVIPENVVNTPPQAIAYNLFCCSACQWPIYNPNPNNRKLHIGTSYIYNSSPRALTVVGSTKTGSMLGYKNVFYQNLNSKKVIGESFLEWWKLFGNNHYHELVIWYYGMCILGDPMISMFQNDYARIDLCVRDSNFDYGEEPNTFCIGGDYWESPDIWVRHYNDTITKHVNPEYEPNRPNYVKVRVKNIGTLPNEGKEKLFLHWTAALGGNWPGAWSDSCSVLNPNTGQYVQCGGLIDSLTIPIIQPGEETILTFPWLVPNPADYSSSAGDPINFGFLARIISEKDTMAFPEGPRTLENIKNNNNIAGKRVYIVDLDIISSNPTNPGSSTIIRNPSNRLKTIDLQFIADTCDLNEEIYKNAEVRITMDSTTYNAWVAGGSQSEYLLPGKKNNEKIVSDNNAKLLNITLNPYEYGIVNVSFNFLTKKLNSKPKYTYHVILKDANTDSVDGGLTYIINNNDRDPFYANIDIEENAANQQVTLTAQDINEPSIYNWYNSQGDLIYSGEEITVSNNVNSTYKLEVISLTDGYKDYESVTINENLGSIQSISPNPASYNINIQYQLYNANTANITIIDLTGLNSISNTYIIDLNLNSINIDISSYPIGTYLVYLVCNGKIADVKQLIKQ
ncbi:MAG: hypothetical protein PHP31_07190 [Lentimicrobiaceae bacterium]|nr:hypothetical protein [Lentimicrobiaceae bacterium]